MWKGVKKQIGVLRVVGARWGRLGESVFVGMGRAGSIVMYEGRHMWEASVKMRGFGNYMIYSCGLWNRAGTVESTCVAVRPAASASSLLV